MNELIQKLVDELGVDEAIAQQAIGLVLGALKDKVPAGLGDQLENILNGEDDGGITNQIEGMLSGAQEGGLMNMLSGFLGKK